MNVLPTGMNMSISRIHIWLWYTRTLMAEGSYTSAEVLLVYSTAPADWAIVLGSNPQYDITVYKNCKYNVQ